MSFLDFLVEVTEPRHQKQPEPKFESPFFKSTTIHAGDATLCRGCIYQGSCARRDGTNCASYTPEKIKIDWT